MVLIWAPMEALGSSTFSYCLLSFLIDCPHGDLQGFGCLSSSFFAPPSRVSSWPYSSAGKTPLQGLAVASPEDCGSCSSSIRGKNLSFFHAFVLPALHTDGGYDGAYIPLKPADCLSLICDFHYLAAFPFPVSFPPCSCDMSPPFPLWQKVDLGLNSTTIDFHLFLPTTSR